MTQIVEPVPVDTEARRRALATVGIMAFGRKDYDRAEQVQSRLVRECMEEGAEPTEIATALYNLANTYLRQKRAEEAVETLHRAIEGCIFHKASTMLPMLYCNLGVALHRAGEADMAFGAFKVARDYFRAQKNIPSEAHVCDCLAAMYLEQGKEKEAEQTWLFALHLYDQIKNPNMQKVRECGRAGIELKLEHFIGCRDAA